MNLEQFMEQIEMSIAVEYGPPDSPIMKSSVASQQTAYFSMCIIIRGDQLCFSGASRRADRVPPVQLIVRSLCNEMRGYEMCGSSYEGLLKEYPDEPIEYIQDAYVQQERITRFFKRNLSDDELTKLAFYASFA